MKNALFSILLFALCIQNIHAQSIEGSWQGELAVMGQKIPLIVHFSEKEGEWSGKMDSPNQGAMGIAMRKVLFDGTMLSFEMSMGNASYEGLLLGEQIKGNFSQSGMSIPLDFTKAKDGELKSAQPNRPQNPQEPFEYEIQELSFENSEAGILLKGTLTKPAGNGPFPTVVLISGSGPHNRDHEIMGHRPFWVMADYLTNRGIAVLRYDERGVGESKGVYTDATTIDLMTDVSAALDFLKSQDYVDSKRLGVIGHSEGGLISWMLGAEYEGLDFLITMAPPVIPITELMDKQTEAITRVSGANEMIVKAAVERNREVYQVVVESNNIDEIKPKLKELFESQLKSMGIPESMMDAQLKQLQQAYESQLDTWMINFLKMKPADYIHRIDIPVFAAFGSKDLQVDAAQNGNELIALFSDKPELLEVKVYENQNHLFQTAQTGAVDEYAKIEESISYLLLEDIVKFIESIGSN
ncbi:alpha/beta hydrolase family protein [Belliella pelovolcani]|uniref:Serine aminopeptidase S33 domain-containing protein n=1 Tax=Belliella pelovolcani TaxID=529505 RepID=A0A1N7LTE2_9BACT|nr:alpha/beta fold hydrolase [Belliella pelovolcani]SIS77123.1 hypothetical protein SAMN05421761_104105 [Belliella pelovolcani]